MKNAGTEVKGKLEAYIQAEGDNMVMFVIDAQKIEERPRSRGEWFIVWRITPSIMLSLQTTVIS